ncbi:MAG: aminopeptidase P family protein [Puniceicoccales bacterium]|jgi:Xaa-Pro aminopeptidase|nr:aminopeptidase P family protein [Puniceicoccales bacterium]
MEDYGEGTNSGDRNRTMSIKLTYASPEQDADLLYWSGIFTCDPFLAFEVEGQRYAISNVLEIDEMRHNSKFDEVFLPRDLVDQENPRTIDLIQHILERFSQRDLILPKNFPAHLVLKLQEQGINFSVVKDEFLPERSIKSSAEMIQVRKACAVIADAFWRVRSILAEAEIRDKFLYYDGGLLTSERIRMEIAYICFEGGAIARETIIACGRDAAFPHNRGRGPLKANEFIVVDIFPRLIESGYYGDMTRTLLRGQPSKAQIKMYDAVKIVQNQAVSQIRAGKNAKEIHEDNMKTFTKLGYPSTDATGFFHNTGHGVGLALHENPSIGERDHYLQNGEVITVEPGLYYPEIGGVRIEDVVAVAENGVELLSNFSYEWVV